jgi:protoporphyrinogen oxidase
VSERRFVVVGAGPAGLTAAHELTRLGHPTVVLEKLDQVGGLARTESLHGYHFDLGGHRFFTKVKEVGDLWREVGGRDYLRRPRLSRIYYRGTFFAYPLRAWDTLKGLGPREAVLILASYLRAQLRPSPQEDTFEQWVSNRFGARLFGTFFKSYTEKVWGVPCSELRSDWAAQRIRDLSVRTLLVRALVSGAAGVRSLIEEFDYPRLGPGMMWRAFRDRVTAAGGEVRTGQGVVGFLRDGARITGVVVRAAGGEEEVVSGTDFISSMPLGELVLGMRPPAPPEVQAAASRLRHRDFLTVCVIVDQPDLFPDNWIYVHEPGVRVARIQNFKNWSPDMVPDARRTSLGLEYFCNQGDELWNESDASLVARAGRELEAIGLCAGRDVVDARVVRVPHSYPLYDEGYRAHLEVLRGWLGGLPNLQTMGRNGLHRYNNQDHSMLTALLAVRNALHGEGHDLWSVNADEAYHEEDAEAAERSLAVVLAKVDAPAAGVACASVASLALVLATLVAQASSPEVRHHAAMLGQFLPGYGLSPSGVARGALGAAVAGFTAGAALAALRNALLYLYTSFVRRRLRRAWLRELLEFI